MHLLTPMSDDIGLADLKKADIKRSEVAQG